MAQRIKYWDLARGIAMIMVVVGHIISYDSILYKIIYSFHMPLFMLISGYFFSTTLERYGGGGVIILNKAAQLLLPLLFFGTICYFLSQDISLTFKEQALNYYGTLIRALWFLNANFMAITIVTCVNRLINKPLFQYIAFFLITCSFLFFPDLANTTGAKFLFPYFVAGLFWGRNKNRVLIYYHKHKLFIIFSLAIFYTFLLSFFNGTKTFYNTTIFCFENGVFHKEILNDAIYRVVIGFLGSFLLMALLEVLYNLKPQSAIFSPIIAIGEMTLPFYCIHIILHKIFIDIHPEYDFSMGELLLYIFFMIFVCYFITVAFLYVKSQINKKIATLIG